MTSSSPEDPRPSGDVTVRRYRPDDEATIRAMFEENFGRTRSHEQWSWRYERPPSGRSAIFLAEDDHGVVGHSAYVGFETFIDGRKLWVAHGGDAMVASRARGRGVYGMLVRAFETSRLGYDVRVSFPGDYSMKQLMRFGAGSFHGQLEQWVRWRTVAALERSRAKPLSSLARPVAALVLKALSRFGSFRASRGVSVEEIHSFEPEFDELAERSGDFASMIRVRDSRYLTWRWLEQPERDWRVFKATDRNGDLAGVIVFGPDPSKAGIVGRIVDLLAVDAPSTRALVMTALEALEIAGCEVVTLDYWDPRSWSRRVCYRCGLLPRGAGANVVSGPLSAEAARSSFSRASWYLTLGDTDLA